MSASFARKSRNIDPTALAVVHNEKTRFLSRVFCYWHSLIDGRNYQVTAGS